MCNGNYCTSDYDCKSDYCSGYSCAYTSSDYYIPSYYYYTNVDDLVWLWWTLAALSFVITIIVVVCIVCCIKKKKRQQAEIAQAMHVAHNQDGDKSTTTAVYNQPMMYQQPGQPGQQMMY